MQDETRSRDWYPAEYTYNGQVPGGGSKSLRIASRHKLLEPDPVSTGVGMGECLGLFTSISTVFLLLI